MCECGQRSESLRQQLMTGGAFSDMRCSELAEARLRRISAFPRGDHLAAKVPELSHPRGDRAKAVLNRSAWIDEE